MSSLARGPRTGSHLAKVRAWLAEHPQGNLNALYKALGGPEMSQTLENLTHLESRQELSIAAAHYRYSPKHGNEREKKQTRLFRTMRSRAHKCRAVDFDDLVSLTQTNRIYAMQYMRFLQDLAYVIIRPALKGKITIAVLDKTMHEVDIPHFNQRRELRKKMTQRKGEG